MTEPVTLYNTLSETQESVERLDDDTVRMFVCGVTECDDLHLGFEVCSNAARVAVNSIDDLPDGAEQVSSGVGELIRLQSQGYAYIRP